MRANIFYSTEAISFEEYVNKIQYCEVEPILTYKSRNRNGQNKEISLERMFQRQKDKKNSHLNGNFGEIMMKKSRFLNYKYSKSKDSEEQANKQKSMKEPLLRLKNIMAHAFVKPIVRIQSNSIESAKINKKSLKNQSIPEALIIQAEAVVWQEKKTTSLSDVAYSRSERVKPETTNKLHRVRIVRQQCKEVAKQSQLIERANRTAPKYEPRLDMPQKNEQYERHPAKKKQAEILKIQSQPKMDNFTNQWQEETEQSITFLKNVEEIVFDTAQFQTFQKKDEIFGHAFSIVQLKGDKYSLLYEHNATDRLEIASLTKTMTCLLVLLIIQKFGVDTQTTYVKVNQKAAKLKGTTANLIYSDFVILQDLLYGLMLPSGNDAAYALAEWGGRVIRQSCQKRDTTSPTSPRKTKSPVRMDFARRSYLGLFIFHMNVIAKSLKMQNTKFANVHGLMNKKNYSTSTDIIKLCLFCMRRRDFSKIVNTRQYSCIIANKKFANERETKWQNTNKLLQIDGFCGVKTGITPTAGPCLASCFRISQEESIYIVLLKTKSLNHRFQESKKLLMEVVRMQYAQCGYRHYLMVLSRLNGSQWPETVEDHEDRNDLEDEES